MNVTLRWLLALVFLALVLPLRASAQPTLSGPQTVFFSATGHHLDNRYGFLDYWRANGQMLRFGAPITEVIEENGRPVQYFERARLEHHVSQGDQPASVQIGTLGRELTAAQTFPVGAAEAGQLFSDTGYTLFGSFLQYWNTWNGPTSLGSPISEEYAATLGDGAERHVQWFERGRLEYWPERVPVFYQQQRQAHQTANLLMLHEVELGNVGYETALARGYNLAPVPRQPDAPEWSPALWPQRIDVNLSTQQLTAYEGDLPVFQTLVSSGRDGAATVQGTFHVYAKLRYDDMRGNIRGEAYNTPKVPFVLYFVGGYAIHGTYWHAEFGTARRSHGCVNLPPDRAEWLWEWAQPSWSDARARRFNNTSSRPQSEAEAALQPLEGLAVRGAGPVVVVHR